MPDALGVEKLHIGSYKSLDSLRRNLDGNNLSVP
jgi:hypothetical protein